MSTPTKEQILRAFSPYIGQGIMRPESPEPMELVGIGFSRLILKSDGRVFYYYGNSSSCKLLLRDISSLTTDEKVELVTAMYLDSKYAYHDTTEGYDRVVYRMNGRRTLTYTDETSLLNLAINNSAAFQYFLSIGINLPLYELGGLTPVEAKIATIKKEEVK